MSLHIPTSKIYDENSQHQSVRSARPLHCFEYINYKGRAGRPGKSASGSVYLVCDESDANDTFSEYFTHSPEDILPNTVLMAEEPKTVPVAEELGIMALAAAASKGGITSEELGEVIMDTLSGRQLKGKQPQFGRLLPWLGSLGFVRKKGQQYELTDLGRKVNEANISPMDALAILKLGGAPSTRDLISLGVNIDLVSQLRETSARKRDPTEMLLDWIEEMPIDAIKEKYHGYWDDGDILQLGEYTAIALDKIATFLQREELAKTNELLMERLRHGVKQDIVKAGLTRLPLIMRNKARVLARSLRNNGYSQLMQLSKERPQRLAKKLSITERQAEMVIQDCKSLTPWDSAKSAARP
jgi:replicative superfamily II helicase